MNKIGFLFLILVLMVPAAFAKQGHMKLLAVRETETGYEGGIADLYLEVKPGSGRVFLETFPLTRTDTQMSTRFAKAIACDAIEKDCDDVDFFYTITADSAIIAGPSAGASIAILTVTVLEDLNLNEDYAITGTINSGGLIGPVGGLRAKVEAAKRAGLKKVLIPAGEIVARVENQTVNLSNLSKQLGIEIVEVSVLSEGVKEFTGTEIKEKFKKIEITEEYISTMKSLAKNLCDRSNRLKSDALKINYTMNISSFRESAINLTAKGRESFEKGVFYSSASYCFGANVEYSTMLLLSENLTDKEALAEVENVKKEISKFSDKIEKHDKKTITDLEAYIVIKERLAEADEYANQALELISTANRTEGVARAIAYAKERVNSASSWSSFLGKEGKTFNLNKEVLKKSCQTKISEADERKQYVELYLPNSLDNIQSNIERANLEMQKGNYELCLSIASRAKADVDIILSVFGVENDQYKNLVERKLEIVRNNIAREASKGLFPILGYSYYEYANSLKDRDLFSALLYSEYALELGNLDIYFKESDGKGIKFEIDKGLLGIFILGMIVGGIAVSLVKKNKENQKYKPKQNSRMRASSRTRSANIALPGKKR